MRRLLIFLVPLVIAAATCAAALAARSGPDSSFGRHGAAKLDLTRPAGVGPISELEWLAAPDGSTYVSGSIPPCDVCHSGSMVVLRFDRDGRRDRSFGGVKGYAELPMTVHPSYWLGLDGHGRPLLGAGFDGVHLWRFTKGGRPDPSFGGDGAVWLPQMLEGPPHVQPLPGGGILVSTESESEGFVRMRFEELREDGRPRGNFGRDGFVAVDVAGDFHLAPAVAADGSILIAATGCCVENVTLAKVSAKGRLDTRFNRAARQGLAQLTRLKRRDFQDEPEAFSVLPRADGGVDIFGGVGEEGFDARLRASGRAAAGWGTRGLRILPRVVYDAVPLRDGGFFALGSGPQGLSAFALGRAGRLDRRFRPVSLGPESSYETLAAVGPRRAAVAYGRRTPSNSTYLPYVRRFVLPSEVVGR